MRLALVSITVAFVLASTAAGSNPHDFPAPQVIIVPGNAPSGSLITSNGCFLTAQIRLVITASSGSRELLITTVDGCYYGVQWISEGPGVYSVTAYDANPKNPRKAFLVSTQYGVT